MDQSKFFFCYSKQLSNFLYDHSKLVPITIAKNPKSDKLFSLYPKNKRLKKALDDYSKHIKNED